jgi:hypothetical protein
MANLDLTAGDRCDQCGAQAWIRAWIDAAKPELLFCGHHWHDHEAKFLAAGGFIFDQRDRINATLDVSPA